jgi:hypothetical protein
MTTARTGALWALIVAPAFAWGQTEAPEEADLRRPETHVVVEGSRLSSLAEFTGSQLRLYAVHDGELRAIPFQVDERTPDGGYVYDQGAERRSDTDDGRLDENDELAFMARDAGDRALPGQLALGQVAHVELRLRDPLDGGRAWVYVLAFREPPRGAERDYVDLTFADGEPSGWAGRRGRFGAVGAGNLLALDELRFRDEQGELGPDVLDRAKLRFEARYLFTDLVRHMDEVRCGVLAWRDGPVRAIVGLVPECYLIWGHWLRPAKGPELCRLIAYGSRFELELVMRLPVDLEPDAPSSLRVSLDFASLKEGNGTRVWSDRNPTRWRGGSSRRSRLRELDRSYPGWICVTPPGGTLLARLELDPRLRRSSNALFLQDGPALDPPEDEEGSFANAGFHVDLTGLVAGVYRLRLAVQLGPAVEPGHEDGLLKPETPLSVEVGE